MMPLGPWELMLILLIVVVIFGAGKLSGVGSALGKSVRDFKAAAGTNKETEEPAATTPETRAETRPVTRDETVR